ncbi:MAG TPA: sulfatase-like hydrolase/transferase, partial [Longimicrobiales bacterium]|nr:sulfatase-like hydrolase/transferase [Longimicrobiales bacterium]
MWTGVHARHTGLWDNTNFAWTDELSADVPTIGHLLREQGYHTAFKGKWHLSAVPRGEDALERYGFSDYQQWGEIPGAPWPGTALVIGLLFLGKTSVAIRVVRVIQREDEWLEEREPPQSLESREVTVLDVYGDL